MESSDWEQILPEVIAGVYQILVEWKLWRYVGPRMRLVNKHWKQSVDDNVFHVSIPRFPTYPSVREIPSAVMGKKISSFFGGPIVSRRFKFSCLGNAAYLTSLRSMRFSRIENVDEVLTTLLPLFMSLTSIHIDRGHWTQIGIDALSQYTNLTALKLLKMQPLTYVKVDYDYSSWSSLIKLKRFTFDLCRMSKDLSFMSNFTKLETFEFDTFEPIVRNIDCIAHLPKLKALSIVTYDMYDTDLRFIYSLEKLTALNINIDARKPSPCYTALAHLRKFGTLSRQKKWIVDGLNEDRIFYNERMHTTHARHEPQRLKFFGERESEQHLIKNLTAIDVADLAVSIDTLSVIAKMQNLKELRMHMCNVKHLHLQSTCRSLHFWTLKTWTISAEMTSAGKFAQATMPRLENIGVWNDHGDSIDFLSSFTLVPNIRHFAFAMGEPWMKPHTWELFENALEACKSLKHIGWKDYKYKRFPLPDDFIQRLTQRGILVDEDITIFQLFTF